MQRALELTLALDERQGMSGEKQKQKYTDKIKKAIKNHDADSVDIWTRLDEQDQEVPLSDVTWAREFTQGDKDPRSDLIHGCTFIGEASEKMQPSEIVSFIYPKTGLHTFYRACFSRDEVYSYLESCKKPNGSFSSRGVRNKFEKEMAAAMPELAQPPAKNLSREFIKSFYFIYEVQYYHGILTTQDKPILNYVTSSLEEYLEKNPKVVSGEGGGFVGRIKSFGLKAIKKGIGLARWIWEHPQWSNVIVFITMAIRAGLCMWASRVKNSEIYENFKTIIKRTYAKSLVKQAMFDVVFAVIECLWKNLSLTGLAALPANIGACMIAGNMYKKAMGILSDIFNRAAWNFAGWIVVKLLKQIDDPDFTDFSQAIITIIQMHTGGAMEPASFFKNVLLGPLTSSVTHIGDSSDATDKTFLKTIFVDKFLLKNNMGIDRFSGMMDRFLFVYVFFTVPAPLMSLMTNWLMRFKWFQWLASPLKNFVTGDPTWTQWGIKEVSDILGHIGSGTLTGMAGNTVGDLLYNALKTAMGAMTAVSLIYELYHLVKDVWKCMIRPATMWLMNWLISKNGSADAKQDICCMEELLRQLKAFSSNPEYIDTMINSSDVPPSSGKYLLSISSISSTPKRHTLLMSDPVSVLWVGGRRVNIYFMTTTTDSVGFFGLIPEELATTFPEAITRSTGTGDKERLDIDLGKLRCPIVAKLAWLNRTSMPSRCLERRRRRPPRP
jgi:hypothetical protein